MSINSFKCIYCGNSIENSSSFEFYYDCHNHLPVNVRFWLNNYYTITAIKLAYENYYICIFPEDNNMDLYSKFRFLRVMALPLDKSLTPKNFNNKVKTYLTFQ